MMQHGPLTLREREMLSVLVEHLIVCPPDMEACFNRDEEGPVRCWECWVRWLEMQVEVT